MLLAIWFGLGMSGLLNLMHEAAHFHVFKQTRHSKVLGRYLLGPLSLSDFDGYRVRHWQHHKKLGEADDSKYLYKETLSLQGIPKFILFNLCGLGAISRLKRVRSFNSKSNYHPGKTSLSWILRTIAVQVLLALALLISSYQQSNTWSVSLFSIVIIYMAIYSWGICAIMPLVTAIRTIAEHKIIHLDQGGYIQSKAALRNLKVNFITRLFLGAYGFDNHATHHLKPNIPYYHLPSVTSELNAKDERFIPQYGYLEAFVLACERNT